MSLKLSDIRDSLEGMLPSTVATCSSDGVPNVANVSQVYYYDADHVALSNQFFNKTFRNINDTSKACAMLIAPADLKEYHLALEFVRSETEGALFDTMRRQLKVIESMHGLSGVFNLRSADVYRVISIEPVEKTS